ncbi:hypothetical protein G9A89_020262 [Geosiphon pyriformis]|nr:hypothetical protein G9A89_020262 [Geosiphon pyriformis]
MPTTSSILTNDQCVPEFENMLVSNLNHDHSQMINEIPITYYLEKLHELGPSFFGDKLTAFAELNIEGIDAPFYVHKEYLVVQSLFFREIFQNINDGDKVTISIPSPETFAPILEFLYDGDAQKWYNSITMNNYYSVWQNVEFLELTTEIKDICLTFYQNEIEPRK